MKKEKRKGTEENPKKKPRGDVAIDRIMQQKAKNEKR